jgi:hypothetical protein
LAIVCLLALSGAGALSAQKFEIAPTFGYNKMPGAPLGSLSSERPNDDDVEFNDGKGAGVRFTWNTKGYYGHEFGYIRNRPELTWRLPGQIAGDRENERVNVDQLFYNFMIYFMPAGEKWRPFITGGLQGFQYGVPSAPEWSGHSKSKNYGGNYGGGIKLMPFNHLIIRFDFRHYMGGKPYDLNFQSTTSPIGTPQNNQGGIVHQFEGSMGIAIAF